MKTQLLAYLFILIVIGVFTAQWQPARVASAATRQVPAAESVVPPELAYASEFVGTLERAGLTVSKVARSHLDGMFVGTMRAAYIQTDLGVVEVVFFDGSGDAEKVRVRSESIEDPTVPYRYYVEGQPTNGQAGEWHTSRPAYFLSRGNLFIVTSEKSMARAVRRALSLD